MDGKNATCMLLQKKICTFYYKALQCERGSGSFASEVSCQKILYLQNPAFKELLEAIVVL